MKMAELLALKVYPFTLKMFESIGRFLVMKTI